MYLNCPEMSSAFSDFVLNIFWIFSHCLINTRIYHHLASSVQSFPSNNQEASTTSRHFILFHLRDSLYYTVLSLAKHLFLNHSLLYKSLWDRIRFSVLTNFATIFILETSVQPPTWRTRSLYLCLPLVTGCPSYDLGTRFPSRWIIELAGLCRGIPNHLNDGHTLHIFT
jgi:hypothetical protein